LFIIVFAFSIISVLLWMRLRRQHLKVTEVILQIVKMCLNSLFQTFSKSIYHIDKQ